jgi:hypothetical protein
VIIHIYMEVPQGNSLRSYFKQAKMLFPSPSFAKLENRREKQVLPEGLIAVGRGGGGERE